VYQLCPSLETFLKYFNSSTLAIAAILAGVISLSACTDESSQVPESPAITFVNGAPLELDAYRGQWVLMNYWAIWCKPCIKEMPELNALHEHSGISVFAYNFDQEKGDALQQQASTLDINMPMLATAPAGFFGQEPPSALPATIVIDPQGLFHSWLMGPQTASGIKRYLKIE
jgi:thiol-disulfide isomerase/thioredoxin